MKKTARASGILGSFVGLGFLGLWTIFWSAGTLLFDVQLARSFIGQVRALGYPTADGVITESKVEVESDSEGGASYTPAVTYRYTVARQERTGNRLQYQWASFGSREAYRIVARFPVGSRVPVYYNPRDPSHALLLPGLDSGHALIVLFSVPFNLVMLACLAGAWLCLFSSQDRLPWMVKTSRTAEGLTLRLPKFSPLMAAAIFLGIASLAGVFVAAFGSGTLPQGLLVGGVWAIVLGGACLVYRHQHLRARLLTIDDFRGQFSIREANGSGAAEQGRLADLASVALQKHTTRDSDGDEVHRYSVALVQREQDGEERHLRLISEWTEALAEPLANWLANTLQLPLITSP